MGSKLSVAVTSVGSSGMLLHRTVLSLGTPLITGLVKSLISVVASSVTDVYAYAYIVICEVTVEK